MGCKASWHHGGQHLMVCRPSFLPPPPPLPFLPTNGNQAPALRIGHGWMCPLAPTPPMLSRSAPTWAFVTGRMAPAGASRASRETPANAVRVSVIAVAVRARPSIPPTHLNHTCFPLWVSMADSCLSQWLLRPRALRQHPPDVYRAECGPCGKLSPCW
jgi:hypothetical protein